MRSDTLGSRFKAHTGRALTGNNRPRIAATNGNGAERRSFTEERVIRMLRGDQTDDRAPVLYAAQFGRLRDLAYRAGMRVNVLGTIWLGTDELLLFSWLAQAQQVLGYTKSFHSDATLTLAVVHCAGTFNALGIQLPPLAFQHATLVEEAELLSRRGRRVRRWQLSRVRNPEPASPVEVKC